MNLSLKQPKDVLVLFFGIAGLILVVFPLFMMIVLKKGVLKSWHGLVVKIKTITRNRFSLAASQLSKQNSKRGD